MKVIIQATGATVECWMAHQMFTFPDREPVEVESDFMADHLLKHFWDRGLVEVKIERQTNTRGHLSGWSYNTEQAIAAAEKALVTSEDKLVQQYVKCQYEDRLRRNLPAMPPQGAVADIIARRNIDLEEYGIHPVGVKAATTAKDRDALIQSEQASNERLAAQVADLTAKLNRLIGAGLLPEDNPAIEQEELTPEDEAALLQETVSDGNGGRKPRRK